MYFSPNRNDLQKIVVLNPKGGCGKSTLATSLASYFSLRGPLPALLDCDPQGFSMRWLENRPPHRPPVHGIAAYKNSMHETRSWQLRVPTETTRLIIDTPAGIESTQLHELVYDADNVLIPIMPSPIDMRYAVKFIADLILVTQIERGNRKLGIVANRTRANTHSLRKLMRFLSSLNIPLVTVLRDSQNFVHAAERGLGVYEMPYYKAHRDIADLSKAVRWLEKWQTKHQRAMAIAKSETDELPARPLH